MPRRASNNNRYDPPPRFPPTCAKMARLTPPRPLSHYVPLKRQSPGAEEQPAAGAAGGAGAGAGGYIARALAASAAFGIVLGEGGEALRTDAEGGGGGGRGGGGARVSPLWRQRFFVQVKCEIGF